MTLSRRLGLAPALLIVLIASAPPLHAAGDGDAEAKLEDVRRRIQALDKRLNQTRMKRDGVATELRETERAIGRVTAEIAGLDRQRNAQRGRLEKLERRRGEILENMNSLRKGLARYVRAAYATGRQDQFKLLLNQENPATLSRALTYYAYFNRERAGRIRALATDLRELADIKDSIARDSTELARLRDRKSAARERLAGERRRRRAVVATLAEELVDQNARLTRLRQDEQKLEELVRELARELAKELAVVPPADVGQVPFRELKGKLPWPTVGSIRYRFGTPRAGGDLSWKGVLVSARPGTPVHAVSHGRVAFADWLRGFGLLMIIEHGDGYMSLYGHSESLFKDVGDWVEAGERIGLVGDSGGRESSGLYFEIRHRGKPVNPMRWCGKGPAEQTARLGAARVADFRLRI
jgi:septal ring factor EnvC (AmiA/AmiB activator)